jgi:AcrR family transcriptional regulator
VAYRRTEAGQARLDAQRARIVAAATQVLAEQGYAGFSIAAVAQRAGVATGTVYNHVPGKAPLVAEVFADVAGREVAAVRAAVAGANSTAAALGALVETFAQRAFRSGRLAYALLAEPVAPEIDALRLTFRQAFRDLAADVLAAGVERGDVPDQDVAVTAAALVGAIAEALTGPLAAGRRSTVVPALVTFVLRSTGAHDVAHA